VPDAAGSGRRFALSEAPGTTRPVAGGHDEVMAATAAYDEIADWYENQFLAATDVGDPIGVRRALATLLGPGAGRCLEIGCGTGVYAAQIRELGRTPVGVDLSAGMLGYAGGRLPVARADAARLPVRDASVDAAVAVMVHTDMPDYPAVVREAARVLRPGGTFVHIGVHPAFCGGFADRTDPAAVVIRPGYLDGHWTKQSWTAGGVRDKVGATHWPVPALLQMFLDAGLTFTGFLEGGVGVPTTFSTRTVKGVRP
jgi:ubiquinone/menaquinone biosynthesis C-methylase UbiE